MYTLVTIADVIQVAPSEFHKPSMRAIEDWINAKYADKVLHKVGLCVGFHSLVSSSEGLIGHGTGIVNINVDFRLVVFRPFKGEILRGTISRQDISSGIELNMTFFDDVLAPPDLLFEPTTWSVDDPAAGGAVEDASMFVWRPPESEEDYAARVEAAREDGQEVEELAYYFDQAEKCMFRVEREEWTDLTPQQQRPKDWEVEEPPESRKVPYRIIGSMMLSGLGPTLWWEQDESGGGVVEELPVETTDGDGAIHGVNGVAT